MSERVSSRDVFKPNARVSHTFAGRIVGGYHRCGPDTWDDYAYRPEAGDSLSVVAGLRVQAEEEGARVRLHHHGEVVVVEWQTGDGDAGQTIADTRAYFFEHYLGGYASPPGQGAAAAIARLLRT